MSSPEEEVPEVPATEAGPIEAPVTELETEAAPVESSSEAPVEAPVESSSEAPVEAPVESSSEAPVEAPVTELETEESAVKAPVTELETEAAPVEPPIEVAPVEAVPAEVPVEPVPKAPVDFRQRFQAMDDATLVQEWASVRNPTIRKTVSEVMTGRGVWPSKAMQEREETAGLYPNIDDPQFASRLYQKREFYEARATLTKVAEGILDPCSSKEAEALFELTPIQRLVSRFLHPQTPYMGLLLFHGVGVGKTCSAVTIAEQFLEVAPTRKVIVLVPQAIQENFKRTVFDTTKLVWGGDRWISNQCTGTSYLERLGLLRNPDLKAVQYAIEADRRKRYTVSGYQAFANWIDRSLANHIPAGIEGEARQLAENEVLRRLFSDHLIVIDEAHNLRDVSTREDEGKPEDAVAGGEAAENAGGKALNPYLKRIVLHAEGLRLVLMTATPMYNSAPEIVRLLNYLWMNDSKKEKTPLQVSEIFSGTGELINPAPLEAAARRYVSYMRGENPFTFPLRMRPVEALSPGGDLTNAIYWPRISATKKPVEFSESDAAALNVLPIVFTEPEPGTPVEKALRGATTRTAEEGTASDVMLDLRMQMANITYPNNMYGTAGWEAHFSTKTVTSGSRKIRVFTPQEEFPIDSVFHGRGLLDHAPKIHRIVKSITAAQGICFVYSRYIKSGALPLAIALERAGFQRKLSDGRIAPLLNGVRSAVPICALCGNITAEHEADHPFSPAYYVLLTSEDEISPDFPGLVKQATSWTDKVWGPLGNSVKVIIGSQVASEGLDLKCIREMHILDSWYHLNRTDQIIGRAIRYCSHSALRETERALAVPPMSFNNCLIYLHATIVTHGDVLEGFETADMYAYRLAVQKAQMVGRVQRLLKKHAWDCNLEMEAIVFTDLPKRHQIDAQENVYREYSANDQDYTTYCDYQVCKHECAAALPEDLHIDSSTFTVADARRVILQKMELVRQLFADTVIVPESAVLAIFKELPAEISSDVLLELLDGKRFKIRRGDVEGFLIKRAGYLVFQPSAVADMEIPLALRYARAFQLRRRLMIKGLAPTVAETVAAPVDEEAPTSPLKQRWLDWVAFVDKGDPAPDGILPLWSWILKQFGTVPETKAVALRWWFDKRNSYEEQKNLIELALAGDAELEEMLAGEFVKTSSTSAYRIYNPVTREVEYYSRKGGIFSIVANKLERDVIAGRLQKPAVSIPTGAGTLLGFLAPKVDKVVFKSLDTTTMTKTKGAGAECGNTSKLGEHFPRVFRLHAAAREDSVLSPHIIPDGDPSNRKREEVPLFATQLGHQPVCLYMEFLSRLLDKRDGGRRWFLSLIEAADSGLKSRK